MPYALRVCYTAPTLESSLPLLLQRILDFDPNVSWALSRATLLPARSFRELIEDAASVAQLFGSLRWPARGTPLAFDIQTVPQLTFTVRSFGTLGYLEAREFMRVCTSWLPCDFGALHRLTDPTPSPGSLDYLARAAINLSAARYEALGPLIPGSATFASQRLIDGVWSPTEGAERPTEGDYRSFCAAGLGAPFEWKGNRVLLKAGPSWRALPSLRVRPSSRPDILNTISATCAAPGPVDLEDLDVPEAADFTGAEWFGAKPWFLGLRRCSLRWSNLEDARCVECGFDEVDLTGAVLTRVEFTALSATRCSFRGADFTGARIVDGRFEDSSFAFANLSSAVTERTEFIGCDFGDARLDGSSHQGSKFIDCALNDEAIAAIRKGGGHVGSSSASE